MGRRSERGIRNKFWLWRIFLARRQQSLMPFLRDRREFVGEKRPAFAVVFTAKYFATGGAAEDRAGAVRLFEAERAELMLQASRESAGETLPIFAAVFAAINFPLRTRPCSCLAPLSGVMFGGGDEHEIGIF